MTTFFKRHRMKIFCNFSFALVFCCSALTSEESIGFPTFNFIWQVHKYEEQKFNKLLESKYFLGEEFGPIGTIEQTYDWIRKKISYSELKEKLIYTALAINPSVSKKWIKNAQNGLLEEVLGLKNEYNVEEELHFLRSISESEKLSSQKLIQRTLSLISFDALDEKTIPIDNIKEIYNDLNITDIDILPECIKSSAVNFISICLYQDSNRRIRIHSISPCGKTEFPHNHYGPSASIILAGSLVNQFLGVYPANHNDEAEFGLYLLENFSLQSFDRSKFSQALSKPANKFNFVLNIKVSIISSHLYRAGNYYFIPSPREDISKNPLNDALTFHRIDTQKYAVTLFTQILDRQYSHTTLPVGYPKVIYKYYDEIPIASLEEAQKLSLSINKKVNEDQ